MPDPRAGRVIAGLALPALLYTWSNVPAGSYTATGNVTTTSSPVNVGAAVVTQTYYIYTDQPFLCS